MVRKLATVNRTSPPATNDMHGICRDATTKMGTPTG